MSKLCTPRDLSQRVTIPLLVALAVLFLLGPAVASPAFAKEDATHTRTSEHTILQEGTSSEVTSGRSLGPDTVKLGDGEAIVPGAYAGRGCAKAGPVTAGDCDEKASGGSDNPGRPEEGGDEPTEPETTAREPVPDEPTSEGTTLEGTTLLEETTLIEETTGGEITSTASRAPGEGGQCPTDPPKDAVEATVEHATDGDTLTFAETVEGYDTVRLIGVDTPELGEARVHGRPEPLAEEASDFTTGELEGQKVLLQIGEEEADRYGRLLAYVWTGEAAEDGVLGDLKRMVGMGKGELFNLKLLEEGYAEVLTIEPNDLYAGCFEAAEREARDAGVGIWVGDEGTGGPAGNQYDEETTQETTAEASPPRDPGPDTKPMQHTPVEQTPAENAPEEVSAPPENDPAAAESGRQPSAAEDQYEQSPQPEARSPESEVQDEEVQDPEIRDKEIQEPEVQEPEVQESVAPSGGDEAAVLETGPSPAASVQASASPEPTGELPVQTASAEPVSALPETGGPSLLAVGAGLAAAGLLGGTMSGFLAVRSLLRRAPDRR